MDEPSAGPGGWLAVTVFVVASAAGAPLLVARGQSLQPVPYTTWALQLAIVVYAALRLGRLVLRGRPHWMALLFWIYVYVWLGLAPLAQVAARFNPLLVAHDPRVVQEAAVIVLVGLLFYDGGQWLAQRRPARWDFLERRQVSRRRVRWLAAFAVLTLPYFVGKIGGVHVLLTSRQAASDSLSARGVLTAGDKSTYAVIIAFATVPPFLSMLALWLEHRTFSHSGRLSLTVRALFCALLVTNALVNNPLSNPRYWVLGVLLAFLFATQLATRAAVVRGLVVTLLLAGLVVFPYLDFFRYTSHQAARATPIAELVHKTDYDSMAQVQDGVDLVHSRGHTEGRQLLGAALFFVPRSHWAGKPEDTGTVLAKSIHFPNTNLSAPLWVETWLDLSWFGLAVVFAAFGYLSRRLDRCFEVSVRAGAVTLARLGVPVLAGYQVLVLRGSLLQSMSRLAVLLLVLWWLSPKVSRSN